MVKFDIPKVPPTTTKSIRFPNTLIDEVNNHLIGTDCTFTAFVVEAVRFALKDLREDSNNTKHTD